MEAFRQDVDQEAADELVCRKCHVLVPLGTLDPVVLVFERDAHRVSCDQAAIRDGDAMRVAREVLGRLHHKTIHALWRPASDKRQGTKSRAGRGSVSPLRSMWI